MPEAISRDFLILLEIYVLILAGFVGFQIISKVPSLLHTPLMSATNAISAISLVGSLIFAGAGYTTLTTVLGFIAVAAAATNAIGGFLITDRMLRMFKRDTASERQNGTRKRP